jgi:hypothetical protein
MPEILFPEVVSSKKETRISDIKRKEAVSIFVT